MGLIVGRLTPKLGGSGKPQGAPARPFECVRSAAVAPPPWEPRTHGRVWFDRPHVRTQGRRVWTWDDVGFLGGKGRVSRRKAAVTDS